MVDVMERTGVVPAKLVLECFNRGAGTQVFVSPHPTFPHKGEGDTDRASQSWLVRNDKGIFEFTRKTESQAPSLAAVRYATARLECSE